MISDFLISYDPLADVVHVLFRAVPAGGIAESESIDDCRLVNFDGAGEPVGVEFLEASHGIQVDGVPRAVEIEEALASLRSLLELRPVA
jgi:uncharacterized protein YuzE